MWRYRIFESDSIEGLKELPSESVDLIVTDPPYGIDYSTFRTKSEKMLGDNNLEWVSEFTRECGRVLKHSNHLYCFVDPEYSAEFILGFRKAGFKIRNLLTIPRAVKGNGGNRIFQQQNEFCIFATKGKKTEGRNFNETQILKPSEGYLKDKRYQAKEWLYRLPDHWHWTTASVHNAKTKLHPTEKNVEALKHMVELSSNVGDVVLDPFMGSGSTGEAALNLGRKFIGYEIDPDYFEVTKNRLKKLEL